MALRLHLPEWGKETPQARFGVKKVITSLGEDGNRIYVGAVANSHGYSAFYFKIFVFVLRSILRLLRQV